MHPTSEPTPAQPDEKSEPAMPAPPPSAADWEHDLSDARNEDAKAQPLKAAGCSIDSELRTMEAVK